MKKFTSSILLFLFVFANLNINLKAQQGDYTDPVYGHFATPESRVVTTIRELDNGEVHIEAVLIGMFHVGTFQTALGFNPNEVKPINGKGGPLLSEQTVTEQGFGDYLWLDNRLKNLQSWKDFATGQINWEDQNNPWTYILVGGSEGPSTNDTLDGTKFRQIFKIYFKKLDPNKPLADGTFIYHENPEQFPPMRNSFSRGSYIYMSGWVDDVTTYRDTKIFTLRSPSTVKTLPAVTKGLTATLKGYANRVGLTRYAANLSPIDDAYGGLDWDNIKSTGFIYSTLNVPISIDEYSDSIKINGVNYAFPNATEITAKSFTRGIYTFKITSTAAGSGINDVNMSELITGLTANVDYHAYAYMIFDFQTSADYPLIGEKITFRVDCNDPVPPPVVNTPYTYTICDELIEPTLADIFVDYQGESYQWYADETLNTPLQLSEKLVPGTIYYVTQTIAGCESGYSRVAVKVDELGAPQIEADQRFCEKAGVNYTLADIVLPAGIEVNWYKNANGGLTLDINNTLLKDGDTFWAALVQNGCVGTKRTKVTITIDTDLVGPEIASPQYFCNDITLSNINTLPYAPEAIIWFYDVDGEQPITDFNEKLTAGTYYAALAINTECTANLTPVVISYTTSQSSFIAETQKFCGNITVADIVISGYGIRWFTDSGLSDEITDLTTPVLENVPYYAANTVDDCLIPYKVITIKYSCGVTIAGTVFPLVYWDEVSEFNELFAITVSLKAIPDPNSFDPIDDLYNAEPLYTPSIAVYYDGDFYIPGTPKFGGALGSLNNFGVPIDFESAINKQGTASESEILDEGQAADIEEGMTVGYYKFEDIVPGDYILEIYREGYLIRWAKIVVNDEPSQFLAHREIIPGDMPDDFDKYGDLIVNNKDLNELCENFENTYNDVPSEYLPFVKYDINADGRVNNLDMNLMIIYSGFWFFHYNDTREWLEDVLGWEF